MIDPKQLAASTLQLLQADPRNYRNFSYYWFFVKALMKRYYTKDNLYMLGDYEDPAVVAMMPDGEDLQETLTEAVDMYRTNAAYGMGTSEFTDPDGETFTLHDEDAGY
jgi:hypothetical protein